MPINLLTTIQQNLALGELKRIDPNTQETISSEAENEHRLTQATVSAVSAGIYNLARSEEGLIGLATAGNYPEWPTFIFGDRAPGIIEQIEKYASRNTDVVLERLNKVAAEGVRIVQENASGPDQHKNMREFISAQRDNILPYLPAELHLGEMLEDNTLDDRTNKMRGPMSTMMHKIQTGFNGNETKEQADAKKSANF